MMDDIKIAEPVQQSDSPRPSPLSDSVPSAQAKHHHHSSSAENESPTEPTEKKKREGNFQAIEDVHLAKAWLEVNKKPFESGTYHTSETFWQRIHAEYDKNRGQLGPRSQKSLLNRWNNTISPVVTKFVTHVAKAIQESGEDLSPLEIENQARTLFREETGKPFTHSEAYEILKVSPRFQPSSSKIQQQHQQNQQQQTPKNRAIDKFVAPPHPSLSSPVASAASSSKKRPRSSGINVDISVTDSSTPDSPYDGEADQSIDAKKFREGQRNNNATMNEDYNVHRQNGTLDEVNSSLLMAENSMLQQQPQQPSTRNPRLMMTRMETMREEMDLRGRDLQMRKVEMELRQKELAVKEEELALKKHEIKLKSRDNLVSTLAAIDSASKVVNEEERRILQRYRSKFFQNLANECNDD